MAVYGSAKPLVATIADGQSLSGIVDLAGSSLVGIMTSAGWATADLTFQTCPDSTTCANYCDVQGAEIVISSVAASSYRALDPSDFAGVRFVRVRSGTSGSPVAQSGGDNVSLIVRAL